MLAVVLFLVWSKSLAAQDAAGPMPPDDGRAGEILAENSPAGSKDASIDASVAEGLPDAPQPQTSTPPQNPGAPAPSPQAPAPHEAGFNFIALFPPAISPEHITAREKFQIYAYRSFGPQSFFLPVFSSAFYMINPPSHYPHDWKDGGGAFGRLYGEELAASTSSRTGQLLAEVALHEEPRYVPSGSGNLLIRTLHAVAFTFVDKTDSGRNTLAVSNFAGAVAGAFVGMAILPPGYNNVTHAEQRAVRGFSSDVIRNIATEFRPEWAPLLKKIHVPKVLPDWWTPRHPQQP